MVKGSLFLEYVMMIKANKDKDWAWLQEHIKNYPICVDCLIKLKAVKQVLKS